MKVVKRMKCFVAAVIVMSLMVAMSTGCSKQGVNEAGKKNDTISDSKSEQGMAMEYEEHVELEFILVGPEPKDMASVAAKLNELSERDLNLTVNWTFLGWENLANKYNLVLSSGEKADMIYTATWNSYQEFAKKGAYLPLNDYLADNAPLSWEGMSDDAWKSTMINGSIYTVPCDWQELMSNGIAYRADIAKELGIDKPIKSWEEFDAYMAACKEAYPEIIPFDENVGHLLGSMLDQAMMTYEAIGGAQSYYCVVESIDSPNVLNFLATPEFKRFVETAKSFYDSGYWSKNVLSKKDSGYGAFTEGRTFAIKQNITQTSALYTNISKDHPEWEIGFFGAMDMNGGVLHPNVPIGNGIALPKGCSDPERALAYIDKLRYDPDYYTLTHYGIEGKHFDLDEAGSPVYKGSPDEIGFGYHSMQPWGWHVDKMELPVNNVWPQLTEIYENYGSKATFNKLGAFAFDPQVVSAEAAALTQVFNQYGYPLVGGNTDDIEGDIAVLNEKLEAAGLEEYLAEMQRQLDEYWAAMDY